LIAKKKESIGLQLMLSEGEIHEIKFIKAL